MDCIFCKIIDQEIKTDFIYQDEQIVAFKDLHPMTPVHVLIIPKRHIPSIVDITEKDKELMGQMILVAKKLADDLNLSAKGYKLLWRVKEYGGQEVDHLHLHLIGGAPLYEDIHAQPEK